tara:strand:- start:4471 stop:4974 length:504 start_codon:yes stop_codon:yes gene_type:complete
MAYQKLQAGRAWSVNPSDNTDIPNTGLNSPTGTTTTGSATQLIDANRVGTDPSNMATLSFLLAGIKPGMIIVNTTDSTQTTVLSVVNATTLLVKDNVFAVTSKNYAIYGGAQDGAVLYVGASGNIRVTTAGGDDVTFVGVQTGTFFPVQVVKVWSTSTTATDIMALW